MTPYLLFGTVKCQTGSKSGPMIATAVILALVTLSNTTQMGMFHRINSLVVTRNLWLLSLSII